MKSFLMSRIVPKFVDMPLMQMRSVLSSESFRAKAVHIGASHVQPPPLQ